MEKKQITDNQFNSAINRIKNGEKDLVEKVVLNFLLNEQQKNIIEKYKNKKNFKLVKDAELIFFNLDSVKDFEECYIVEGEMDALSLHQAGVVNVLSVPNGATLTSNNLAYIDNSYERISHLKRFHIATDNDIAGRKLREDISLRLGKENCDYIVFGEHKDANDCLQKEGYEGIMKYISNKIDFPIEGVFTVADISDDIDDFYHNGLPIGAKVGITELDKLISFHKGYLTIISGIPSHGKSSLLDDWLVRLNINEKWNIAYYSPENKPTKLHFSKLARLFTGKWWDGAARMSFHEMNLVKEYVKDKIWFIKPEKDFTLDTILASVKRVIVTKGLDCFVIDAWNKLEHKEDTTGYVGKQLDKLADFCELNNVHCFLVAHPTKMRKTQDGMRYEIPTLYDIAGSANFYNKADLGVCVYRNFETNTTTVLVQKVKFNHWGETGSLNMTYDKQSGRYSVEGTTEANISWLKESVEKGIVAKIREEAPYQYNVIAPSTENTFDDNSSDDGEYELNF